MEDLFSNLRISREQRHYDAVSSLNQQLARLNTNSAPSEVGSVNYQPSASQPRRRIALEDVSTSGDVSFSSPVKRTANPFSRLSIRSSLCAVIAFAEHKYDTERAECFPPLLTEYLAPTFYQKSIPAGVTLLNMTEAMLNRMIPKMFIFQKKLADEAFRVTLRQLLGDQFENLRESVCADRGWESAPRNLFAVASRRSGKTSLLAAFCAAFLVCVYRMTIIVYSVAMRSAQEFVRLVQRYIQMIPEGRAMMMGTGGAERLALHGPAPEDERWIRSFPSGGNSQNVSLSLALSLFFFAFFFTSTSAGWEALHFF